MIRLVFNQLLSVLMGFVLAAAGILSVDRTVMDPQDEMLAAYLAMGGKLSDLCLTGEHAPEDAPASSDGDCPDCRVLLDAPDDPVEMSERMVELQNATPLAETSAPERSSGNPNTYARAPPSPAAEKPMIVFLDQ